MQNAGLDEAQAGIKTAGRNINNFRYAEELKSLLMKVKESEKTGLKFNIKKTLAPWKKCYDKPRQHIKKQRHHLTDKGLYSQSYGCF